MTVSQDEQQLRPPKIVLKRRKRASVPAHFREEPPPRWTNGATAVAAACGIAILAIYLLLPLLSSAYVGQDARNSQIPLAMQAENQNVFSRIADTIKQSATSAGRFVPLADIERVAAFTVFDSRESYKAFQLSMVLGNIALLAVVVGRIARNVRVGLLAALFATLALQLRPAFDPILSFSAQQFVVTFVLLSLWVSHSSLRSNRSGPAIYAGVAWTAALLTHESALFLLPLFVAPVAMCGTSRKVRLTNLGAIFVPAAVLGATALVLRSLSDNNSSAYAASFDLGKATETFTQQVTAAIPLSYPALSTSAASTWSFDSIVVSVLMTAVALGVLVTSLRHVNITRRNGVLLAITGMSLWALPALLVAFSATWQTRMPSGMGYGPSYLGYFGFALTATSVMLGLAQIRRALPKAINASLVLLLAIGVGATFSVTKENNDRTIASFDSSRFPQETFERSIQHGIFTGVLPGSSVVSLRSEAWTNPAVIEGNGGPEIRKIEPPFRNASLPTCTALNIQCFATHDPQWMMNHSGGKNGNGISVVARITAAQASDTDRPVLLSNDIYLYVESPLLENGSPPATLQTTRRNGTEFDPVSLNASLATRIGNGDGWALWHYAGTPEVAVDSFAVTVGDTMVGQLQP